MLAVTAAIGIILSAEAQAQDAAAGKRVFESQCSICHSPRSGRTIIGPSLFGVVNRHSGSIPGYNYSQANRRSGIVWNVSILNRYLAGPQKVVPGTYMTYGLLDDKQRADLIAYLATLH